MVTAEQKSLFIDFFTEAEVVSVVVTDFVVVGFVVAFVVVLVGVGVGVEFELPVVAHLKLKSESRRHSVN